MSIALRVRRRASLLAVLGHCLRDRHLRPSKPRPGSRRDSPPGRPDGSNLPRSPAGSAARRRAADLGLCPPRSVTTIVSPLRGTFEVVRQLRLQLTNAHASSHVTAHCSHVNRLMWSRPRRPGLGRPGPRVTVTSCVAELAEGGSTRARASPCSDLEDERAARSQGRRARHARPPPSHPRRRAPRAAPSRAPRARASRSRPAGRRADSRRRGPTAPVGGRANRSRCDELDGEPGSRRVRAGRPRARRATRRSRSRARRGCSSAIASAIAPLPGPDVEHARRLDDSRMSARQRSTTTSVSGRGTRTRASTVQRQPPESPLAEDVRERLARARGVRRAAPARRVVDRRELPDRSSSELERDVPSTCASRISASTSGARSRRDCQSLRRRASASAARHATRRRAPAAAPLPRSASVKLARGRRRATWSSRCIVSLIRWSVTRFSGKL